MASKKKTSAKQKSVAVRFVILNDGSEQEIVREDGKYFYTACSQFRKAAYPVRTAEAAEAVCAEDACDLSETLGETE